MSWHVVDAEGVQVAVGDIVRCGDRNGRIMRITEPDGDAADDGTAIAINPRVTVGFRGQSVEDEELGTSVVVKHYGDQFRDPMPYVCEEITRLDPNASWSREERNAAILETLKGYGYGYHSAESVARSLNASTGARWRSGVDGGPDARYVSVTLVGRVLSKAAEEGRCFKRHGFTGAYMALGTRSPGVASGR